MSSTAGALLLQPSLLDRLIGTVQMMSVFEIEPKPVEFTRSGLDPAQLTAALTSLGVTPMRDIDAPPWQFSAAGRSVSLAEVTGLQLRSPGGGAPVPLESVCSVRARMAPATASDTVSERRAITGRKLREYVLRDLAWLLNAVNLQSTTDLGRFPRVAASVLNFGMPGFIGNLRATREQNQVAQQIRTCIEAFEPRLTSVVVTPETDTSDDESFALSFRIDADLWGDPLPQHLTVRTQIDVGNGAVMVEDRGG
jgi:type VI secretion system protein ImpF